MVASGDKEGGGGRIGKEIAKGFMRSKVAWFGDNLRSIFESDLMGSKFGKWGSTELSYRRQGRDFVCL